MDNNELLKAMIEYQISTFKDLQKLQAEYSDLQAAYRMQCVTNAHLIEQLKYIHNYIKTQPYITREDLMATLGLEEDEPVGCCQCKHGEDALSALTEDMQEVGR